MPRAGRGFPSEPLARPVGSHAVASSNANGSSGVPLFTTQPLASVTMSGNGSIALVAQKNAKVASVSISANGNNTLASSRTNIILPATFVVGGGGRIGRSMPVRGAVIGGITNPRVDTFTAQGSANITGQGVLALTGRKNSASGTSISANGSISVSSSKSLALLPTMVVGGGGRIGRSMPVRAYIALPSNVPVPASTRSSPVSISGNGQINITGAKQIEATSEVLGFPPIFQNFILGSGVVVIHGGGSIAVAGIAASNNRAGSATVTGNGNIVVATAAGHPQSNIIPIGPPPVFQTFDDPASGTFITSTGQINVVSRKNSATSTTISGNGVTNVIGKRSPRQTISISSNGTVSTTGSKNARSGVTITGNGAVNIQITRTTARIAIITGNGSIATAGRKSASGTVAVSGNGSIEVGVLHRAVISISGGGQTAVSGRKAIATGVSLSTNGSLFTGVQKRIAIAAAISGSGNITLASHITVNFAGSASLTGNGGFSAAGTKGALFAATDSARGNLSLTTIRVILSDGVTISGNGEITIVSSKIPDKPFIGRSKTYGRRSRSRIQSG